VLLVGDIMNVLKMGLVPVNKVQFIQDYKSYHFMCKKIVITEFKMKSVFEVDLSRKMGACGLI
jgi:hypothetical protein